MKKKADTNIIKYSIVIPHFNSPASLEKLLASIPVREDIQIIVVDDYSTEHVDELNDLMKTQKHVMFYHNETGVKNAGTTRNIGIKHATGKWIFFADADDFFTDCFLSNIQKYYESNYDLIFFSPISCETSSGFISSRHLPYQYAIRKYLRQPNHNQEMILKYRYCSPCSKMILRDHLEKFSVDFEAVEVANDVMFSTKLSYFASSFNACDDPIYCITKSQGTLFTATNKDRLITRRNVFIKRCSFLIKHLPQKDWKKIRLSGKNQLLKSLTIGGFDIFIETYKLLRVHKIRLFTWENYDIYYGCMILLHKFIKQKYGENL